MSLRVLTRTFRLLYLAFLVSRRSSFSIASTPAFTRSASWAISIVVVEGTGRYSAALRSVDRTAADRLFVMKKSRVVGGPPCLR
eukprot:SAG31_NODE_1429_length_8390_cov_2.259076_11_plen_83_part_01